MSFTLSKIVPWGRSYDEYRAMFALTPKDLQRSILGCGDGPAAFNAEHTKRGGSIVSIDPLYGFSAEQIRKRIRETYDTVLAEARKNRDEFVWSSIGSVEELGRIRLAAMQEFLEDYENGRQDGRYIAGALPALPFTDKSFALALCSHFLFLYSQHLSLDFHLESLRELLRVAAVVRVFPVLELGTAVSRHLEKTTQSLEKRGFQVKLTKVAYEFQKGGNEMLEVYG